jgi:hypothetical protein
MSRDFVGSIEMWASKKNALFVLSQLESSPSEAILFVLAKADIAFSKVS